MLVDSLPPHPGVINWCEVAMNIILRIENNLDMTSSRARVGHQGDHSFTTFSIDRPDFLATFSCRAELCVGTNTGFIDIANNSFTLPSSLTKSGNLELQLVFTNDANEVIAKTSIVQLTIGDSISATEEVEVEFPNSGGTIDLSDIKERLTALESSMAAALNSITALSDRTYVVEDDISALNDSLTSINSRLSTNETDIAGLREEATSKWVILNNVEVRNRNNETNIAALDARVSALET